MFERARLLLAPEDHAHRCAHVALVAKPSCAFEFNLNRLIGYCCQTRFGLNREPKMASIVLGRLVALLQSSNINLKP